MRLPTDSRYHLRKTPKLAKTSATLSGRQTQASSEGCWNPEQRDKWPGSGLGAVLCVASPARAAESRCPGADAAGHSRRLRMLGLVAMPLTLRTLRASATVGDPGLRDDAQAPVLLPTVFLWEEPLSCWARYRPI